MFDDDYINSPIFDAQFNRGQLRANSLLLDMVELLASGETATKPTAKVVEQILDAVHCLVESQNAEELGFITYIAFQALRHSSHQHNLAGEQTSVVLMRCGRHALADQLIEAGLAGKTWNGEAPPTKTS